MKIPLVSNLGRSSFLVGSVLGGLVGGLVATGISFLALADALPAGVKAWADVLQGETVLPLVGVISVLCLALFILPGVLQPHVRYRVFGGAVLCFFFGGAGYNASSFHEIDRNDAYRFGRNADKETLADMIARSPDAYVGRDSLQWFRQRAPGATMYARRSAVSAIGIRPHRMAGLANVQISYIDETVSPTDAVVAAKWAAGANQWIRLPAPIGSEIRVAPSAAVPGARLCAWLMPEGVLLVGALLQSPCESVVR